MKAYMISLGCAKNQVDTEMIMGMLKDMNIEACPTPEDADILMVNTCAFIESAREEAINTILDLASFKDGAKKMLVFGCMSQRYKEELEKTIPEVDRFIQITEYPNLTQIVSEVLNSNYKLNEELSPLKRVYTTPHYMRYVKISEGCLNRCAFCAIPQIRGLLVSRTIEDIYEEVKMHVADGVYEINLISQDTTKYGYDIYKKLAITDLLEKLCTIEGNFKIRLLYLYPDIVTDELINCIKTHDKIMPYFDIPIQHSEDAILKKMLRRGSRSYLVDLLKKIRTEIPNAIIRTTLIVGFPYETMEDVNHMVEFIKEVEFDRLGAFTYSREEGTPSYNYPQEITEAEKNRRYRQVMKAQSKISLKRNKAQIGIITDVLLEKYEEDSFFFVGRNYAFAPDDIDGCIYVACKREHMPGDVVRVKILDADEYSLTGEEVYDEED